MRDTDTVEPTSNNIDWRDTVTWYTHQTWVAWTTKLATIPLVFLLARTDCQGLEHVPAAGPCIIAANHIHNFDIIFLGRYTPRYPHFMAKQELYRNPLLGWYFRQLGSFPVNRGESDKWALRQAGRVLADDQMLFMFPEGTRSGRQAQLKRGKVGAVKLALQHRVPLMPVAIWGTENLRFTFTRAGHVNMRYGPPLDLVALAGDPPYHHQILRHLTDQVMQQIAAMLPPRYRGVYGEG